MNHANSDFVRDDDGAQAYSEGQVLYLTYYFTHTVGGTPVMEVVKNVEGDGKFSTGPDVDISFAAGLISCEDEPVEEPATDAPTPTPPASPTGGDGLWAVRDQGKSCGVINSVTGERSGGDGPWCTETELGSKTKATCQQLCLESDDCVGIVWSDEYAAEQGTFYCCQCSVDMHPVTAIRQFVFWIFPSARW